MGVLSMARGRLRLSLRPSPRPRLILTSCTDVVLDTMVDTTDMVLDTMVMDSDTPSTARGLLMLRLRLIPTTSPTVMVTDLDTPDTSDMDTLDMPDSDTADTTSASRLYQDLSVNHLLNLGQKWIVISLKFPSPVLQFQCYHN